MRPLRSAVMLKVDRANRHSDGDCGGCAKPRITSGGRSSLGKNGRNAASLVKTAVRSSGLRISSDFSPICGVNRLNQIFLTSFLFDQNVRNCAKESGRVAIWLVTVQCTITECPTMFVSIFS